ncbi:MULTISPECIES: flavodoxin family protein [Atopobiaceae]|uniref:flavodoxin family protein n=1 Tax=Atopobiaceae TaxID=1643824 RepID=UPI00034E5993|nr:MULTISPECIES: flavodoxin family protein [Atopobiaceae]EPD77419.1 hypothetical protein HMPREF1527_01352 [Atopobium sp. oral taxon 199 str. F0494]
MKTAIVYYSKHHENTKKLLDAIAQKYEVTLINVTCPETDDLSEYDFVGFASGIYYGKMHKAVLQYAEKNLPEHKKVFFMYTCGIVRAAHTNSIRKIAEEKHAEILGEYGCIGFDTFGPLKLIGGKGKGHPNAEEIRGAVEFYKEIATV